LKVPAEAGVTDSVPLAFLLPDQSPLAVQVVPAFDDHVIVALWPTMTVVGATLMLVLAGGGGAAMYPLPRPPPHAANSMAIA
jgi:hypothetical protein